MPDTIMNETPAAPFNRNRSAEIKDLASALAKAQGAMENAEKSAENPAFKRDGKNSTYATLASVWSAIRAPLAANGLAVMQWPRTVEGGVEIETELLHESGQFMRDVLWLPCPQMTVHTVGSAITYGRRYALMAIVGIAPEDDDGNAAADAHKPGAAGSASGGSDFRPARRSAWDGGGKEGVISDARNDGLIPAPKAKMTADALTMTTFCREAIATFKAAGTKTELTGWWRENKQLREDAEAAVPTEYEKMLVAFDDRMDTVAKAVA